MSSLFYHITETQIYERIDQEFNSFPSLKPLNYQRKYIFQGIILLLKNFYLFLDPETKELVKLHLQNDIKDGMVLNSRTLTDVSNNVLLNLDVGLGKTITSLILARLTKELYYEISQFLVERYLNENLSTNMKNYISSYKNYSEVEKYFLLNQTQSFVELSQDLIKNTTSSTFLTYGSLPLAIVARKSLCQNFELYVKECTTQKYDSIQYFASSRGYFRYLEDCFLNKQSSKKINQFFDEVVSFYSFIESQINKNDSFLQDYCYNLSRRSKYPSLSQITIYDEADLLGGDTLPESVRQHNYSIYLTAQDLTKATLSYQFRSNIVPLKRFLKTDPVILSELTTNSLYSKENNFFYNFHKICTPELSELQTTLNEIKSIFFTTVNDGMIELSNRREKLMTLFNELFSENISNKRAEELIDSIKLLQVSDTIAKFKSSKNELLREIESTQNKFIKELQSYCYDSVEANLDSLHLSYLQDKNTVILLDHNQDLDRLKQYFLNNEFKVVNFEKLHTMKGVGNVVLGYSNQIARGLNLQHFDNILFLYADKMTLGEIYQGIGRLDRIGTVTDKNVIILYTGNEELMHDIVASKDTYNSEMSIQAHYDNLILAETDALSWTQLNFTKNETKNLIIKSENLLKQATQGKYKTSKKMTEEEKLETSEKIKFIRKNRNEFKLLIQEIDNQFKENQRIVQSLMAGNDVHVNDEEDQEYISSLMSIIS